MHLHIRRHFTLTSHVSRLRSWLLRLREVKEGTRYSYKGTAPEISERWNICEKKKKRPPKCGRWPPNSVVLTKMRFQIEDNWIRLGSTKNLERKLSLHLSTLMSFWFRCNPERVICWEPVFFCLVKIKSRSFHPLFNLKKLDSHVLTLSVCLRWSVDTKRDDTSGENGILAVYLDLSSKAVNWTNSKITGSKSLASRTR